MAVDKADQAEVQVAEKLYIKDGIVCEHGYRKGYEGPRCAVSKHSQGARASRADRAEPEYLHDHSEKIAGGAY